MYGEMTEFYGIIKDFDKADYFEQESTNKLLNSVKIVINSGGIIAVTGIVGCGKTVLLRRLKDTLIKENKVVVVRSLATDKKRVNINTLYTALFSDLPTDKGFKIPTQPEKRERKLQSIIKGLKKPIAFIVDEAHDLHWKTLIGLKRFVEIVEDANGVLSVVLAGHPKLTNDLKKPTMEEIGARSKTFSIDSFGEGKVNYIKWVLDKCTKSNVKTKDLITDGAIKLLCDRLVTPLQITHYLTESFNIGFTTGTKIINEETVETVISPDLDSIEPKLSRHGYNLRVLCEYLNARPKELKSYFRGQLDQTRSAEFDREIHKLGIM